MPRWVFSGECYSYGWGPEHKPTALSGAQLKKQLSVPRPGEELAECRPLGDPGHCSEGFSRIDVTRFLPFTQT